MTTHVHLLRRLRMSGATPPLLHVSSLNAGEIYLFYLYPNVLTYTVWLCQFLRRKRLQNLVYFRLHHNTYTCIMAAEFNTQSYALIGQFSFLAFCTTRLQAGLLTRVDYLHFVSTFTVPVSLSPATRPAHPVFNLPYQTKKWKSGP